MEKMPPVRNIIMCHLTGSPLTIQTSAITEPRGTDGGDSLYSSGRLVPVTMEIRVMILLLPPKFGAVHSHSFILDSITIAPTRQLLFQGASAILCCPLCLSDFSFPQLLWVPSALKSPLTKNQSFCNELQEPIQSVCSPCDVSVLISYKPPRHSLDPPHVDLFSYSHIPGTLCRSWAVCTYCPLHLKCFFLTTGIGISIVQ